MNDSPIHRAFREHARGQNIAITDRWCEDLRAWRDAAREEEGGGGLCHVVTEYLEGEYGWGRVSVAYLSPAGEVICAPHVINVLPDGSLFDPTADQFGEGDDIRLIRPEDPRYLRYRMEWDEEFNPENNRRAAAILSMFDQVWDGVLDDQREDRLEREHGAGWWLDDKSHLRAYWGMQAGIARRSADQFYLPYAEKRLAALEGGRRPEGRRDNRTTKGLRL